MLRKFGIVILVVSFCMTPRAGYAQSAPTATPADVQQVEVEGLSSCFDQYRFGSTPVVIEGELAEVMQGSPIAISGTIKNENVYPLHDVAVYAKVFKNRAGEEKDPNGPDVVDWFTVADGLTLKAGEIMPISFIWKVPHEAEPGEYQVTTYVASAKRFNMLGLSFTDDVIGSIYDFAVVGENNGAVHFDKAGVKVNDVPYYFATFPPRVGEGVSGVPISARIVNTTDESSDITLSWKLYAWDALREEMLLDQDENVVSVAPNGEAQVAFTAHDISHSVYYLVGTVQTAGGAKSIIGVRFVRENIKEPRLNFVGVSAYPPKEGAVAFACMHSTGTGAAENGKLELSIVSGRPFERFLGKNIVSKIYEGIIPGEINALTMPLDTKATSFDIIARLYQNGTLIDEVTVPYRCDELDALCGDDGKKLEFFTYTLLSATVLLLVGTASYYAFIRQKKRREWGGGDGQSMY